MFWVLLVVLALCAPAALASQQGASDASEFYHALFVRCNIIHEVYIALAVFNSQNRAADRDALINMARLALLRENNPHTQCEDFTADFLNAYKNDVIAGFESRIEQLRNLPAPPPAHSK
jgi:hypothetical protein